MTSITYRKSSSKAKNKGIIVVLRNLCISTLSLHRLRVSNCSRPRHMRSIWQVKAQHHAPWPQGSPSDICFRIINADVIWLKWHRLPLYSLKTAIYQQRTALMPPVSAQARAIPYQSIHRLTTPDIRHVATRQDTLPAIGALHRRRYFALSSIC
jgi:hypothetical protein